MSPYYPPNYFSLKKVLNKIDTTATSMPYLKYIVDGLFTIISKQNIFKLCFYCKSNVCEIELNRTKISSSKSLKNN